MAQVIFKDLVDGFKGKVSKKLDTVYYFRKSEVSTQENKCFMHIQSDRNLDLFPYTEEELAQQAKFKEQQEAVNELYKDKENRRNYLRDAHRRGLTLRQYFWAIVQGEITPDFNFDDSGSGPGSGTGGGGGGNQGGDDDPDGGGALS